jgi:hypothetical protein
MGEFFDYSHDFRSKQQFFFRHAIPNDSVVTVHASRYGLWPSWALPTKEGRRNETTFQSGLTETPTPPKTLWEKEAIMLITVIMRCNTTTVY